MLHLLSLYNNMLLFRLADLCSCEYYTELACEQCVLLRAHMNGRLEKERVTPIEAHSQGKISHQYEHWSRARIATLIFYTACTVHVTIFSIGGKFRPVSIFT